MTENEGTEWVVVNELPKDGEPDMLYIAPIDREGNPIPFGFTAWMYINGVWVFITDR